MTVNTPGTQADARTVPAAPMGQETFAATVEALRAALRAGGGSVRMPDGSTVPMDVPMMVFAAQMVHSYDTLQWSRGGEQGPAPTLLQVLTGSRLGGQRLSEADWMTLLRQYPQLDEIREAIQQQLLEEDTRLTGNQPMPANLTPQMKFVPRQVPGLRDETAAWLESAQGRDYYQDAIDAGRQLILMNRPGVSDAAALADAEAEALRAAQMYFFEEEMCQLMIAAQASMPQFAPTVQDLPAPTGFAVFYLPISHHVNRPWLDADLAMLDPSGELVAMESQLREGGTQCVAVSWRPHVHVPGSPSWRAGGVWMTFYAIPTVKLIARRGGPHASIYQQAADGLPTLAPENEALIAWYPGEGDESGYLLSPHGTTSWARVVLAGFQLAKQRNLSQTDAETVPARKLPKGKARRTGHKYARAQEVLVVRLRQNLRAARDADAHADGQEKSRQYKYRWVVQGFWRNTWFAKSQTHRPQWIADYLKGKDGAPLLPKKAKVTVVGVPQGPTPPAR